MLKARPGEAARLFIITRSLSNPKAPIQHLMAIGSGRRPDACDYELSVRPTGRGALVQSSAAGGAFETRNPEVVEAIHDAIDRSMAIVPTGMSFY